MRRRSSLLTGVFLVVFAGLVVVPLLRPGEPVNAGKPLSAWLDTFTPSPVGHPTFEPDPDAVRALRQIGTNALPALLSLRLNSAMYGSAFSSTLTGMERSSLSMMQR